VPRPAVPTQRSPDVSDRETVILLGPGRHHASPAHRTKPTVGEWIHALTTDACRAGRPARRAARRAWLQVALTWWTPRR
jgi:hypothetical protein